MKRAFQVWGSEGKKGGSERGKFLCAAGAWVASVRGFSNYSGYSGIVLRCNTSGLKVFSNALCAS